MRLQKTIKREFEVRGVGLHTGVQVTMRVCPGARDTGIVFHRTDTGSVIKASLKAVGETAFATTLVNGKSSIKTVEHLLAATAGLAIDNLSIEIDGPEIPALDGSCSGFVERLLEAGVARQSAGRSFLRVIKPVVFQEGKTEIALLPYDGMKISYQINFEHHMLGHQQMTFDLTRESFIRDIAPARTFGFLKDVEYLRSRGLAQGGSLDNAIILDDNGVMNPSGLRFKDEFIRHKVLDFIGDMSLAGFPILGHFVVNRSGHTTNTKFLKLLLANPDCWRIETEQVHEEQLRPSMFPQAAPALRATA